MQQHAGIHHDVLDEQDSLGGPFLQSVLLHAAIVGALVISSIEFQHSHQVWGATNNGAGTAVASQPSTIGGGPSGACPVGTAY